MNNHQLSSIIKRVASLATMVLLAVFSFAASSDSLSAVAFESYVQGEYDSEAAISLKNNTRQQIHSVSFRLTYFNMADKPLDYKDYTVDVEIEPGLTKQVSIPAYQHERQYSYYQSSRSYTEYSKKFKVQYKLLGYNQKAKTEVAESHDEADDDMTVVLQIFSWIAKSFGLVCLFMLIVSVLLFILVGVEAKRLNRAVTPWVLISFFITPIVSLILLLIVGESRDPRRHDGEL